MKNNFLLKAAFTLMMCGSMTLAMAGDIYVSPTGSDDADGLSASSAVKTLSKAITQAVVGDVIHITGMLNIADEPTKTGARTDINIAGTSSYTPTGSSVVYKTWNVNGNLGIIPLTNSLTIIGDDKATCGFDGGNASCIIRQDHSALGANNGGTGVPGMTVINYKNLTFKNGKSNDASGGGGFYLRGGYPTVFSSANFENCDFINNTGNQIVSSADAYKAGGGMTITHGISVIKRCRFIDNKASKGAGVYMQGGTVNIDSCLFDNNDLSSITGSYGAALYTNPTAANALVSLDVKNTVFSNNKAALQGGAYSTNEASNTPTTTNVKFTNCAFVGNIAGTGVGGAAFINNITTNTTAEISFINSTFNNNLSGTSSAGAIAVNSLLTNSKFNLINCTLSGNKVTGTTGVAGAGIRFFKGSVNSTRKILNCIIENNTAVDANPGIAADYADLGMEDIVNADLTTSPSYVAGTSLIIDKSFIGSCKNTDFSTQFPTNNTNYVTDASGNVTNSFIAKLGVFNTTKNYFPLLAGSPAINYGNVAYLASLTPGVTTDQILRNRPATTCSAGAYEFETISGLKNTLSNSMVVYKNANNQLVVKNNDDKAYNIVVCNMVGQIIATAQSTGAITTINKSIKAGVYLVLVTVDGKVSTQKVILN